MSIAVVACLCGSSDNMARNFLKRANYPDWLNIPVHKGREKSLAVVNQLPPSPEKEMLQNYLKNASKWTVIIGYTDTECRWSDIAHNGAKSRIEAEYVVQNFA